MLSVVVLVPDYKCQCYRVKILLLLSTIVFLNLRKDEQRRPKMNVSYFALYTEAIEHFFRGQAPKTTQRVFTPGFVKGTAAVLRKGMCVFLYI